MGVCMCVHMRVCAHACVSYEGTTTTVLQSYGMIGPLTVNLGLRIHFKGTW